jgi:fimbrial isopeptide formation D2 family protein/LPXTG-motif cell wall-anchored protein
MKRVTAAIGVFALAALAALGTAAPASAAPGNIDPAIPRSLTVHKYQLGPTSPQNAGTGQEIPGGIPNGIPIEGVQFTATLIPSVDLLTSAGWATATSLTANSAAPLATGTAYTATTDGSGVGIFPSTMPIGLYLVRETGAPAEVTDPTAPFLVTLPFPTGSQGSPANEWIYDVHVYPKNSVTDLVKTRILPPAGSVEARNVDLVRWAIRASIPTLPTGETISSFVVNDQIDTGLEFVATPPSGVAPTSVTVTNEAGTPQTLVAGTDYTITTAGNTQTVTFTASGRSRLASLPAGTVVFNVLTRTVSVPAGGQITNTATSTVDGATETVSAVTPVGQLTIFAYAPTASGGQTPLAGAQFQMFLTETDARNGTNPVSINGVSTVTTGADGTVVYPALVPGIYWGSEMVPPPGYQLPVPRYSTTQVVAGPTSVSAPVQNYVPIPHNQVSAWALPLTGGDGALWFVVGGVALIVIAIGAAVLVARRRAARAQATA